jgi:ligand-binding sensor domain-containing protein/signal transduction histidine kinase
MKLAKAKQSGGLIRITLLFVLLLGLAALTKAERLPVKIYTTAEGLARDQVNRIRQDSRGFLWFCTNEGLSLFDGYRFINYGREQGLLARRINDFLQTRSGLYWIATSEGLYRFNPNPPQQTGSNKSDNSQKFTAYYPGDAPGQRDINVLYEDQAGTIWCGTSGGLYRFDERNGQWTFSFVDLIRPVENFDDNMLVQAILEDRQGALWINTKERLYRLRPDGVSEIYDAKQGLPSPNLTAAMLEDRNGQIWIGTSVGACQLVSNPDPDRSVIARLYGAKEGLVKHKVTSLLQATDGRLWVGAENGLSEIWIADNESAKIQDYGLENGLSDAAVNALTEDRDGNLWLGSETGGAMKLVVHGFTTYGKEDGLGNTRIGSIFENLAGELCVISGEFLSRASGRKFTSVIPALPKSNTYRGWGWYQTTFQDHAGEWWMPTGEGLVRYPKVSNPEQLAHTQPKAIYTTKDGLPTNQVFRLFEDSHGDIWMSTLGRGDAVLSRWQRSTETFETYSFPDNVPDSAPTAFCENRSGDLWIGFYKGGLLRYRGKRFSLYTQADGLPAGLIRGLYIDRVGRLWIASSDGGIARVDNAGEDTPRFVIYTTAEGLSSNQATCITEDQWGKIYIGTGRGVNQLDPLTGHIKQFTTADGLVNNFINVSFRSQDGALWFGTLQGLSRLIPQLEPLRPPPPAFISALRTAGETYPISDLGAAEIFVRELAADENQIQIDFVGFGLTIGESLRYQYKLEGSNSADWSSPLEQRSVNYANLAPGAYRFLVRAVSADGRFSESPASVTFKILPPIWRRWWFLALTVLLVSYVVFAFDHYRVARLKELNAALTESQKLTEQLTQQGTQLRKANRSLELEAAVTSIISEAATLTDAAPKILQAICQVSDWLAGELWEVDTQTRSMRCLAVWQPEHTTAVTVEVHNLNAPASTATEPAKHNGTKDESLKVAGDNGGKAFSSAPSGNAASPRNAFGFPILLGQEVLGILKLFSRAEQQQDKELFEMMSTIGSHIGQLIDRKRADEALKKSREERLAELQRVRKRIARDLHDDIGSSLTQITILSEVAHQHVTRNEKQGLEPLTRIINVSNELVDAMSDIVWAINPQKDHLSDLLQRMRRFASDIFTARNITFRFQTPGADKNIELGANLRREIFLVFKETVNNVVKHSECSRAEIEFQIDSDWLVLMIKDNGKGFDVASVGDANADRAMQGRGGNGINSMWKRAAEMGGEYKIVSGKGEGTTSTLRIPVNR